MNKRIIGASVLAGLLVFIWTNISFMVLPFHQMTLFNFKDEGTLGSVLKANADHSGIYVLPSPNFGKSDGKKMTKAEQQAAWKQSQERIRRGPFAFVAIHPNGKEPFMPKTMLWAFLTNVLAASIFSWLILKAKLGGYWEKVNFVAVAALAGGFISLLPNLIWWGFPGDYTVLALVDIAVGWFLGGMVIAKIIKTS